MDIVDYAMQQELYVNETEELKGQIWVDFNCAVKGKKLFVFGAGAGAEFFLRKYKNQYSITGILDNDRKWHGFTMGDVFAEAFESINEAVRIMPVDMLDDYKKEEIIVLITSTKYYRDMAAQLLDKGIKEYYILLMMEANQRNQNFDVCDEVDSNVIVNEYVNECCKRPIQANKIVFKSFGTYSDHGKYITEQLIKKSCGLDIVWVLNDLREEVPEGVRTVWSGNWKKCIYEMETAQVWVINTVMPINIVKRKEQIYIHTKHWASITLKKFYLDASTITDVPEDVERWKHNGQCMDYVLTGSRFDTESVRRGFDFHKEVVQVGSPRTDAMFQMEKCRQKVVVKCHLKQESKILLYAPTYRYIKNMQGMHRTEARNIGLNYSLIRTALEAKFGGEWSILLRLHPSVAKESRRFVCEGSVVDVSAYPDSEELASACDIMISDYSSIMFEPAFVKKPVFLFATDKTEYINHEYDFLLDYDSLPFPIAETNEELVRRIMDFDKAIYESQVAKFLSQYEVQEDGHASERAAEFIMGLFDEKRMDNPQVTVIMPSYNVGRYIKTCLESVLAQTLQNMEILVIDAGSEDGTLDILQEYADKDDRIYLIYSERKSYGYQVNMGIRMARGEYIGIVETDDFIEPDMYETLYGMARKNDADYVRGLGKFYREIAEEMITERPIRCPIKDTSMFSIVLNPCEHPEFVYSDRFLWLGLYKAAFAKTLHLNETPGAAYQDIGFMLQVHSRAQKAVYINRYVYHYRLDNIASSAYDEKAFLFLAQECSYKESFLRELPNIWRKYSALELLDQTLARFHQMAFSQHFWKAASKDIENIRTYLDGLYQKNVIQMEDMDTKTWVGLQLFLESSKSLYASCRYEYLAATYGVMLLNRKIGKNEVVIFGGGKRGKYCHMLFTAQKIGRVRLFCDNAPGLQGTRQQGIMVRSLSDAYAEYPNAIYVVPSGNYAEEMKMQLLACGISEEKIVLFTIEENDMLLRTM